MQQHLVSVRIGRANECAHAGAQFQVFNAGIGPDLEQWCTRVHGGRQPTERNWKFTGRFEGAAQCCTNSFLGYKLDRVHEYRVSECYSATQFTLFLLFFFNIANLQQAAEQPNHPAPQQVRLLPPIY